MTGHTSWRRPDEHPTSPGYPVGAPIGFSTPMATRPRGVAPRQHRIVPLTLMFALWGIAGHPAQAGDATPGQRYELDMVLPTLRLGLGASIYAPPQRLGAAAEVLGGAQFVFRGVHRRPQIFVQPLAGYTYSGAAEAQLHAFQLGLGLGVGTLALRGMLHPRAIVGTLGSGPAIGLRTGLGLEAWMGALSLEVSHEVLSIGGAARQGAHFLCSTDLIALGLVLVRRWWQN